MVQIPHWPNPSWQRKIDFGIERMQKMMSALGNPHKSLPNVVHVAGTNGKGSTIAFLRSILEKTTAKVNVYTSPHLVECNERFIVESRKIDDHSLFLALEECRVISEKNNINLSYFEALTSAAILLFSKSDAEYNIFETGIGGRLDATNIFEKVAASVITPISYDHIEYLGDSLQKIAFEKAGIIKQNCPVIVSMQTEEAFEVIKNVADAKNAPVYAYEYEYGAYISDYGFQYLSEDLNLQLPNPNLNGDHQIINAACAIATLRFLDGVKAHSSHITSGIKEAIWPARLQRVASGKIAKYLQENKCEIFVDGAHNQSGALAVSHWVSKQTDLPLYLILGITKGRNVADFLEPFRGKVKSIACMIVEDEPSSYQANILSKKCSEAGFESFPCECFEDAVKNIMEKSGNKCRIIITGSLYLAGNFLRLNNELNYK